MLVSTPVLKELEMLESDDEQLSEQCPCAMSEDEELVTLPKELIEVVKAGIDESIMESDTDEGLPSLPKDLLLMMWVRQLKLIQASLVWKYGQKKKCNYKPTIVRNRNTRR
jgi:hypothetical protein